MAEPQAIEARHDLSHRRYLAERMCDRLSVDFAKVFRLQYVVCKAAGEAPAGYLTYPVGSWFVHCCPNLPVTVLEDANGAVIGLCLGLAVDQNGELLQASYQIPTPLSKKRFLDHAEDHVTWFAGRYVVFLSDGSQTRAYCDPAGSLSLVYNAKEKLVAASLLLALQRDLKPNPDYSLEAICGLADPGSLSLKSERASTKGGFSFGATADPDVRRLTPNFSLSLEDFKETRFWPKPDHDFRIASRPPKDVGKELTARLGRVCNSLASHGSVQFALSGGLDSRMLLASAVADGLHENISLHSHAMSWASMVDTKAATLLARDIGLPIHIEEPKGGYRKDMSTGEEQSRAVLEHDLSSGFVGALNNQIRRGVLKWIPNDDVWMRGNMLELVSAIWWPRPGQLDQIDQLQFAVDKCQVNFGDDAQLAHRRAQMTDWMTNLPSAAQEIFHDFNYIENTLPYTQSGLLSVNHCFYVAPACDRRIFALAMEVAFLKRRRKRLYRHVLLQSVPSFFSVPGPKDAAAQLEKESAL